MSVDIREVITKKDQKAFIDFPWSIYKDDPHWVPPLKIAVKEQLNPKHPFFENGSMKLWIALEQGKIKGRIAAIINDRHNKYHKDKIGFFGFYESEENSDVSNALLETAATYLKGKGFDKLVGPVNPSTNYESGLLVEGFKDPAQIMMTYNPEYYVNLFQNFGLAKAKDLYALDIDVNYKIPEVFLKITERIEKSHKITWRFLNKKKWEQDIEFMEHIYNESWEKNWGFVPMTPAEFKKLGKDLRPIAHEKLAILIEVAGEPAAFAVGLPDYYQIIQKIKNGKLFPTGIFKLLFGKRSINRLRVPILGVRPKFRNLGLGPLMYLKLTLSARELGYKRSEMSWILEDNMDMIKPLTKMGGEVYKTYRIYEKSL